jgi:hypothetical protein
MEWFKDLTCYSLQHFENARNVGWINVNNDFHNGAMPEEALEKLWEYIRNPLHTQRAVSRTVPVSYRGEKRTLGYSEIRVLSKDGGRKFAAPDLIFYYIEEHGYCPPEEFIEALLTGPGPHSAAHAEYMSTYNEDHLWGEDELTVKQSDMLRLKIVNHDNPFVEQYIQQDPEAVHILTREGSLLNLAILNRNTVLSKKLIWMESDLQRFSGRELISALLGNELEVAELLIERKIPYNLSSPKWNPLFAATRAGNAEAVKMLLDTGMDAAFEYTNEFMKSFSVLDLARQLMQEDIVALLNKHLRK